MFFLNILNSLFFTINWENIWHVYMALGNQYTNVITTFLAGKFHTKNWSAQRFLPETTSRTVLL